MLRARKRGRRDREPVSGGVIRPDQVTSPLTITPTYTDRFVLGTSVEASPHQWATATFEEGIDRPGRDLIFQTLLGLHTGPDARPGSVAGWSIESEDAGHVLLSARGKGAAGNLLIERSAGSVSLTTALTFTSPFRATVWRVLSRVHRRLAAPTLREGALGLRRLTKDR